MATGTITSLGIGSSLDLQGILDSLRSADEAVITQKQSEKTELETTKNEFNVINAKFLSMKSSALALSLSSNFLSRSVSSSSSAVAAAVADGTDSGSYSVAVSKLASQSSFQSTGKSASTTSVYVPTIQKSANGFDTTDSDIVLAEDEEMIINYGYGDDRKTITITGGTGGYTLDDLVTAIDSDAENGGAATYVDASTNAGEDGKYYLQIAASSGGTGEENRVMVTTPPAATGFSADAATFSYKIGSEDAVSVSVASDTTLEGLASLINDDENNSGVTASLVDTGTGDTPYRLVLKADDSGEDNRITITSQLDDLSLSEQHGVGFYMESDTTLSFVDPLVIRESDGNNDIVFQEDTGSGYSADITATIADGVYANGDDLAAAVETALEEASTGSGSSIDYLVSWDEDNSKLKIQEAGTLTNLKVRWDQAASNARDILGFTDNQEAIITPSDSSLNASITVDGIDYQRQSNSGIDDVITGLTLSFSETGSSNLTVSEKTTDIKEYITDLVSIFNDIITEIDNNDDYDEDTDTWGSLSKTTSIRSSKNSVLSVLETTLDLNSDVTSLYDLGFEVNRDGSISIDEEVLDSMISSNFSDIESFFLGDDTTTGMGDLLNDKIKTLTQSGGLIDSETDAVDERISMIDDQIEQQTERLDKQYETMAQQFVNLDSYMRQMESQQSYVSQMFSATEKNKSSS